MPDTKSEAPSTSKCLLLTMTGRKLLSVAILGIAIIGVPVIFKAYDKQQNPRDYFTADYVAMAVEDFNIAHATELTTDEYYHSSAVRLAVDAETNWSDLMAEADADFEAVPKRAR